MASQEYLFPRPRDTQYAARARDSRAHVCARVKIAYTTTLNDLKPTLGA